MRTLEKAGGLLISPLALGRGCHPVPVPWHYRGERGVVPAGVPGQTPLL